MTGIIRILTIAISSLALFPSGVLSAQTPASLVFADNPRLLEVVEPVRLGNEAFAARLEALRPSREPLGLVLSGGSARAFAHIGVLKALEEKGIRPDYIVANSMGAIVGMMYAAGFSPATIEALVSGIAIGSLIDPVLPLAGGFINAGRFAAFVRSIVGDIDIADLPIPIMIIFEDLETRRQVRVMRGKFADIMAASFALPAVFEAVRIENHLLIDGGITNLVPTSAAYDYSKNVVVSATMYDRAQSFANPFTVINRAIDIGKTRSAMQELLDFNPILIRNDVENISYMEFSRPGSIIARGYDSAQAALPEILAKNRPAPPDPRLAGKSARYAAEVVKAIDDYAKGNEVPNLPQLLVVPVLRFADEVAGDSPFDMDRRYAGFRALSRNGIFTTGTGVDVGLGDATAHAWGLVFSAALRSPGGFFARFDGRLSGAWRPVTDGLPLDPRMVDFAGKAGYVFGGHNLVLSAFAYGDAGIPFLSGTPGWLVRAGMTARTHRVKPLASDLTASWFLDSSGNAGPEGAIRFSSRTSAPFGLRFRLAGRRSLFGPGSPYNAGFAFRGSPPPGNADAWITGTVEAVWRARVLEFDAGEMIVVQNIEIGPFLDSLSRRNPSAPPFSLPGSPWTSPELAAGITASASFSVMGVSPFDFSVSIARGLMIPKWQFSFNTGRLFK